MFVSVSRVWSRLTSLKWSSMQVQVRSEAQDSERHRWRFRVNNCQHHRLTHLAQSYKMGTVAKGCHAKLVNRPFWAP